MLSSKKNLDCGGLAEYFKHLKISSGVWQLSCSSSQGVCYVYQAVLMRSGYTHLFQWFVFPKTVI